MYSCDMTIRITRLSYPIDNWGTEHRTEDPVEILEALREQDSDDDRFEDERGQAYFIDDLIGKEVRVGEAIITV